MREETELSFMYCLAGLVKGHSIDARYLQRKLAAFKLQRTLEESTFLPDVDSEVII